MTNSHQSRRSPSAVCRGGKRSSGLPLTFEMTFPADPGCARQVRRVVSARLDHWSRDSLTDAVLLATTEAFANAVTHGSRSRGDLITVAMECGHGQLRVSVSDEASNWLPIVSSGTDSLAESGRGLALIEAFTDAWGVEPADEGLGKTVWFAFNTTAEVPSPPPAETSPCSPRPAIGENWPAALPSYSEGRQRA
ncbi:ATP-binding protein [Streptomyces sp. NPDC090493]|uniref:ATP-binding protein n=1 Tax=Streptomyces sp. NPDC090493 TaxID=3365964 RepID=UPI0037F33571